MASFDGFPSGSRSVPVPAALLGSLLAEIDNIAELRCTLRFFWYLGQLHGPGRSVPSITLESDEVLLRALESSSAIREAMGVAVARGTLLVAADASGERQYLANDPDGRRTVRSFVSGSKGHTWSGLTAPPSKRANIFALYEDNIGMVTPMLAEELRDAEATYSIDWIEAAVREAVENNVRTWRYVARILERWTEKGRSSGADGKPGGHPQALTATEYRRRIG